MTSKERFLTAIRRQKADRLPVTTHHVMHSFLEEYFQGKNKDDFFDYFGLDPVTWEIGGFDQFHFFTGCTPEATRREVRRCFEAAGGDDGFILSPSDHFFEADMKLLEVFADEAKKCIY